MTEALGEVLQFARDVMRVKAVFAHISVDNIASVRNAQKVNFQKINERYYEELHGVKYLHDVYRLELTMPVYKLRTN